MYREVIPAGESRQYDGPVYGYRLLDFGAGATTQENGGVVVPVSSLFAAPRKLDRLLVTGPIVLEVGGDDDDMASVETPGTTTGLVRITDTAGLNVVQVLALLAGKALAVSSFGARSLLEDAAVGAAAYQSPIMDFRGCRLILVQYRNNTEVVGARPLTMRPYKEDGATLATVQYNSQLSCASGGAPGTPANSDMLVHAGPLLTVGSAMPIVQAGTRQSYNYVAARFMDIIIAAQAGQTGTLNVLGFFG